jgi:uncharacterized protein
MRNRRMDLHGKRIVLTGASSGIGRELAIALAAKGAILVLAARRHELLDGVAAEIEAAGHQRPIVIDTDLSTAGAAESLGKAALRVLGGTLDVVINNAGANVTGPQSLIGDSAQARTLFEVNVWSPLALTATLLPSMMAAGSGVIVNVTSTVQAVPLPLLGYYGASKAALAQATKSLRLELAETPIRVLEVVPGSTTRPCATSMNCRGSLRRQRRCRRCHRNRRRQRWFVACSAVRYGSSIRRIRLCHWSYRLSDAWWPVSAVAA